MLAMNKTIVFALVCLFGYVQSETYSIGVNLKLAHEGADCAADADTITAITDLALEKAGMKLTGNSDKWKVIKDKDANNGNGNGNGNGRGHGMFDPDFDGFRKLLGLPERHAIECSSACRDLCLLGLLYYCHCCSCCGNRHGRRRLRVSTEADRETIQFTAATEAKTLFEELDEPISCLDKSHEVVVEIEEA